MFEGACHPVQFKFVSAVLAMGIGLQESRPKAPFVQPNCASLHVRKAVGTDQGAGWLEDVKHTCPGDEEEEVGQ